MKKEYNLFLYILAAILAISMVTAVPGAEGGFGFNGTIESFAPRVFMDPNARIVLDDYTEPGAISQGGEELIERINNYAFEGEQVQWDVLVWDKNGVEMINDVYVKTINSTNENIESNCVEVDNCYGTPADNTCSDYDYDECSAVDGCSLLCDRYVDNVDSCDGNSPCDTTIQAAITAATPGDMICVFAGTYTEIGQIVINKDLTIIGADKTTTIIKPNQDTGSSGDAKGWFLVNNGIKFNLKKVTLDGAGYKIFQGIRDYGSGTIEECIITNILYEESGPSYAGTGVVVFGNDNVDIKDCEFSEIGRVGVLYYGTGITNSEFSGNKYTGKDTGDWLDYGVEIGAGAKVKIKNNSISDCNGVASVDSSTSAGILVTTYYGSGTQADITQNEITDCDTAIAVGYDGSDTSVVTAHLNNFLGNNYGIDTTAPVVDAENNWWGASDGPGLVGPGSGDKVSVNVDYTPWATTAFDISIEDEETELPICEGTPTPCNLMGDETTCETVDGCSWYSDGPSSADFWEGEEHITEFNATTMQWYKCFLTVETPASMYGQYSIFAEAEDDNGQKGRTAESETWFFNPVIALGINGAPMNFGTIRPGAVVKSNTLTIGNAAEIGSGVMLDMYIAGTDFYGNITMCPTSNQLKLENFRYYATNGAYKTCSYQNVPVGWKDAECYIRIPYYMTGAGAPANNNMQRIIDGTTLLGGEYPAGNVLSPGSEISMTFKLSMPMPCNGGAITGGQIKIFGEAI